MDEMGCGFKWLFVEEDLRNTPSYKTGIPSTQEQTFRTKMAMLIQTIGSKSRLTQLAMNTSIIFMHRFFMYRTVRQYPRLHLAVAFAFAGGKVEESFCKLEHLVRSAVEVIRSNKNREFLDKSDQMTYEMDCLWRTKMETLLQNNCNTESGAYQDMRKIILECEAEIYAVIGFNLSIIHPHNFVVKMCSLLGSENTKDISHYAYNLATASSQLTMLCLKYKPEFIAIMCLSIAAKAHNVEFRCLQDGKNWYQAFDESIMLEDVEAVSREFVDLAKNYSAWKDANGHQVFLNRRHHSGQSRGQSSTPQASGSRQQQQPAHIGHSTPQSNSSLVNPAPSNHVASHQALGNSSAEVSGMLPHIVPPPHDPSYNPEIHGRGATGLQQHNSAMRQNPVSMGNGRNGSAGSVNSSAGLSREQAQLSRSQQQRTSHPHGHHLQQQPQHPQQVPLHQSHQHHQHPHHYQQQQQQQRPPAAPSIQGMNSTASRATVAPSQPGDLRTASRQPQSLTASSHALGHPPQTLHHSASTPALSHLTPSSSSRELPASASQPLDMQGQTLRQQPRTLIEQGRQRQLSHPTTPQDLARSQSIHRSRLEAASMRSGESPSVDDRRLRPHRSSGPPVQPSLQHHQPLPPHHQAPLAADLSMSRPHQQQLAASSRHSAQAAVLQQQRQQQIAHPSHHQQQQLGQQPEQQPQPALGQHLQQHERLVPSAQQQQQQMSLSHRHHHNHHHHHHHHQQQQQQNHLPSGPREAGELSPHTPPLPYPAHLVTPTPANSGHSLPGRGSGDAPQPASQQAPRNGQSQDIKESSLLGTERPTIPQASGSSHYSENPRAVAHVKPFIPEAEVKPEPSTSGAPYLNDRVLKIKLEPCSSSPVQSAAKVKGENLASSPADDKMLSAGGGTSNFTKPQDSPSNPRIKIKVKREQTSNERHSVKYADSGLKIKIKPPKPEGGEVEPGASASGHSSMSSTPREEGELEGTPSPASSTSSGRKSEGLRIRLSVPKPEGSSSCSGKRGDSTGDQWSNSVSERESSSGHRSHHHSHHHGRHHKSKKHSKHSRHEGKSSSKRSASGDVSEERPAKSSRTEPSASSAGSNSSVLAPSLSLQTGGYPGLSASYSSASSSSTSGVIGFSSTSESLHHGGFSITDAFSSTMPNDIFDDDDEDTLPSIPLTPVDALPQVTSHHERFQQMMNQRSSSNGPSQGKPGAGNSG
ncbi:hypothetical protein EGW08_020085 [Elysia chlorotica]|uniref:Uncharacterized protein n=1 Tax=Elysia chlorotica TaxID=188477 RepID=A0A433SS90_ELYCH|nr:hypothetical protein EGW08_020085 [Elysia chlorotica]